MLDLNENDKHLSIFWWLWYRKSQSSFQAGNHYISIICMAQNRGAGYSFGS